MVRVEARGRLSSSSSSIRTYSSLPTSKPRTASFQPTSHSSTGHHRLFRSGAPSRGQRRRKETPLDSLARYIRTGMATIPKLMAPRHIDLGIDRVYAGIPDRGEEDRGTLRGQPIAHHCWRVAGELPIRSKPGSSTGTKADSTATRPGPMQRSQR